MHNFINPADLHLGKKLFSKYGNSSLFCMSWSTLEELSSSCSFWILFGTFNFHHLDLCNLMSPSQSAPTISVYQVDQIFFKGLELKEKDPKNRLQKAGCKKLIQKEKRQHGLFSFWITKTLFFCTLLFATYFLDLFFSGSQTHTAGWDTIFSHIYLLKR